LSAQRTPKSIVSKVSSDHHKSSDTRDKSDLRNKVDVLDYSVLKEKDAFGTDSLPGANPLTGDKINSEEYAQDVRQMMQQRD